VTYNRVKCLASSIKQNPADRKTQSSQHKKKKKLERHKQYRSQTENRCRQDIARSQGAAIELAQAEAKADTRTNEEDQARLDAQGSKEEQMPTTADKLTKRQDELELKGELEGDADEGSGVRDSGEDELEAKGELEGEVTEKREVRDSGGVGGRDERGRTWNRDGQGRPEGRDEEGKGSRNEQGRDEEGEGNRNGQGRSEEQNEGGRARRGDEQGGPGRRAGEECRSNHTVFMQNLPGPANNDHEEHCSINEILAGEQLCRCGHRRKQVEHSELDIETQSSNRYRSKRIDTSNIEKQSSNRHSNNWSDRGNRQSKIRETRKKKNGKKKEKRNKKTKNQMTKEKISNKVFLNTTHQNRKKNTNKWIQI
jgi:hypothetical protein